jgi:hypothetical protein
MEMKIPFGYGALAAKESWLKQNRVAAIDRTRSHASDAGRHRAALHVGDIVALCVKLEVIEPDGDGGVRRAADSAYADSPIRSNP